MFQITRQDFRQLENSNATHLDVGKEGLVVADAPHAPIFVDGTLTPRTGYAFDKPLPSDLEHTTGPGHRATVGL